MSYPQETSSTPFSACISFIKAHLFQIILHVTPKFVSSPSLKLFWKKNRFKIFCWNCYIFHQGIRACFAFTNRKQVQTSSCSFVMWKGKILAPSSWLNGLLKYFIIFFHLKNAFKGKNDIFQK